MRLIGFAGTDGSGKTTLANQWLQTGQGCCLHLNFADALRDEVSSALDMSRAEVYAKPTPDWLRLLLRGWGGYKRSLDPDYWTKAWSDRLASARFGYDYGRLSVVCSDVRYFNEATLITKLGGTIVYLSDAAKPLAGLANGEAHELARVRNLAAIEIAIDSSGDYWASLSDLINQLEILQCDSIR